MEREDQENARDVVRRIERLLIRVETLLMQNEKALNATTIALRRVLIEQSRQGDVGSARGLQRSTKGEEV